jgi:hypothetical protein
MRGLKMKFKKNVIALTGVLTAGLVGTIALVLLVLFGGLSALVWVLSVNAFKIVGSTILILAIVYGKRIPPKYFMTVLIIGGVLVVLPFISDVASNVTLSAIIP